MAETVPFELRALGARRAELARARGQGVELLLQRFLDTGTTARSRLGSATCSRIASAAPMEIDVVEAPPGGVEADVLAFAVRRSRGALQRRPGPRPAGRRASDPTRRGRGAEGDERAGHPPPRRRRARPRSAWAPSGSAEHDVDADRLRTAAARVAARARRSAERRVAWVLERERAARGRAGPRDRRRHGARPLRRRPLEDERRATRPVERLVLCGPAAPARRRGAARAVVAASWTNRCRDLVNAPANDADARAPRRLRRGASPPLRAPPLRGARPGARFARPAWAPSPAVSQGSDNPPRLITLAYEPPDDAGDVRLGLVGKAITFDSGGLSLKPARRMEEMKTDMAGGGAVLAAIGAIAELGLPVRGDRRGAGLREHARRPRVPARRHHHRAEREDDRGDEHGRRGSARCSRTRSRRPRVAARRTSSTSPR